MNYQYAVVLASSLSLAWGAAAAEVIHLKEDSSVTGRILTEKPEYLAVDIGFMVLSIPRNQIIKIAREETSKPAPKSASSGAVSEMSSGLYHVAKGNPPERNVRDLVNELGQAVVQVRTPGGLGSGFILNEDGYLITNFHVIESETQISIEVYHVKNGQLERTQFKNVRIISMNKFVDLALLKIEDAGAPKFSKVLLGHSDELGVGERVFAIGSPLGLERTVTEGIVSTTTRQMQGELYLQTTAQINPGNSGGPLFNLRGEVMGVTNMKITMGEGLGFAIPVDAVKFFLDHRDAYAYDNDNPSNPFRYLEPPRGVIATPAGKKDRDKEKDKEKSPSKREGKEGV